MIIGEDKLGVYVVKKAAKMEVKRSTWDPLWDGVAEYIVPKKDNVYGAAVKGEEKHNRLYDSTAINSNEQLASALHGWLTNSASVWFGVTTGDQDLDNDDDVREWTQKVVTIIINTLNQSNFQSEIHEVYIDLGSFGTACMRIEEDDKVHVRFTTRPIYELSVSENYKNEVDTVAYEYKQTLQQIVDEHGEDALVTDELQNKHREHPMEEITLIHLVEPRKNTPKELRSKLTGPTSFPFASFHVLKDTKTVLKESGYRENPYVIPRWTKLSGEMYGRSPGMKALADIRMINKMKKATIEAAQLVIAPPTQTPDDGVLLPVRLKPNGRNYYRAGTKDRIEKIDIGGDVRISDALLEGIKRDIEKAFFVDQLKLVEKDRMTAEESSIRRDDNLRTLGPILGRQHNELLKPIIERVYNILDRKKMFPPLPEKLKGRPLEIQYKSLIAKAQRSAEAESFTRLLQLVMPLAEAQPELLDNFDGDELVKFGADVYGTYYKIVKKAADVKQVREQRQQQQQQQMQMAQEQHVAEVQSKAPQGD